MSENHLIQISDLPLCNLEKDIEEEHLNYYDYKNFSHIEQIGIGGFGKVYRADWKNGLEQRLALKSFYHLNNDILKEIIHEIKLERDHKNVIRCYGITKFPSENPGPSENILLVMEYADGGTLQDYLKKEFNKLTWNSKYDLAYQLACGVSFLHEEEIVHCGLHSGNVLVHQNKIKLADFGLSKKMEAISKSQSKSVIPYIDPQSIIKQQYTLNEKSDVYSIGVLLWEISSGQKPFSNVPYDFSLALQISQGLRENIVPDTPIYYFKLYTECWDNDPSNRPTTKQVVEILRNIINNTNPNLTDNNFIDDQSSLERAEFIQNSKTNINSRNSFTIKSGCDELKDGSQNRTVSIRDDIDITVQIGDDNSQQLVHLNLKDKLSSIRGKLEHHSMIKMDDALLFAKRNNQNYALIAREEEDKIILVEIMDTENKILYLRKNSVRSDITVKIVSLPNLNDYSSSNVNFNLKDKLSSIREKLKQSNVKMNDTLSFANSSMAEISREDEEKIILKEIIDTKSNTLYLIKPDYQFLINKLKLEYGRTISLDRANKKAFKIKDYDITEIADEHKYTKIDLKEGQFMEKDIFLFEDIDTNKRTSNSTCTVIEYSKVSLKFKIEPDPEFVKAVVDAIESKDPRKFRKITEEFERKCNLEIMLMIIGYDLNFNFDRPDFNIQIKVERHDYSASKNQTQKYPLESDSTHCFGIPVLRKLDDSNNSLVIGHQFYNFGNDENERTGLYTFSYCLKKNHFVYLPDFTFYTFVIMNYSSNYTGMSSLNHTKFINKFLTKRDSLKPKFISLYSTKENNCDPVLLKQKSNELDGIKIKYFKITNCRNNDCICKNKISKDNFKYAYFDPNQDKNLISYMENLKLNN
ncbi:kinase-like protein [Rhizophagus irregularis]|uniref:Kinase-like protein n=1 Tax=Rhizophagus irregularis TaxID=588596 RepID=A0A2N0RGS0_9GLOM|nr:kinase-like protein [Rhizophagus irregularis]